MMFFTIILSFDRCLSRKTESIKNVYYDAGFMLFQQNVRFWDYLFYETWISQFSFAFLPQKRENDMSYRIEDLAHPVHCQCCGRIILYGRADKKFCSAVCKNRWNNHRKNPDPRPVVKRVLRILDRNHNILDKLLKLDIRTLDRLTLLSLGFNMEYATSYKKAGIHHEYACFDIRYELTPTKIKKIVRNVVDDPADNHSKEEEEAIWPACSADL